MKQIAVLTAIVTASMVAGCATPPKTTQEEDMEILKSQVVMLHATLTTCNAALAKDGLRVVPGAFDSRKLFICKRVE
jgi:starvation-inducible outer membrane lipoprotein